MRKINQQKKDPELTQITESEDKDIKTVTITVAYMFKKQEERLNMLSRDRK